VSRTVRIRPILSSMRDLGRIDYSNRTKEYVAIWYVGKKDTPIGRFKTNEGRGRRASPESNSSEEESIMNHPTATTATGRDGKKIQVGSKVRLAEIQTLHPDYSTTSGSRAGCRSGSYSPAGYDGTILHTEPDPATSRKSLSVS